MKILLSLLAAIVLLFSSCVGTQARNNSLLPATQMAWIGVRADIERGALAAGISADPSIPVLVATLDGALQTGDAAGIAAVPWSFLAPYGERGIADRVAKGELAPTLASSLLERLRQFGAALARLSLP